MGRTQRAIRQAVNPASTAFTRWWQLTVIRGIPRSRRLEPALGRGSGAAAALAAPRLPACAPTVRMEELTEHDVAVPNLVGLSWDDARDIAARLGFLVRPDPDGPPLAELGWSGGVVVDQYPDPGAHITVGSTVIVWIERGPGSAGDREPRRPRPDPRVLRAEAEEPTGG